MRRLAVLLLIVVLGDPVAAEERGAVHVVSQAGVEVLWEGVSLGVTNAAGTLLVGEVPPGKFKLTLRKRGFEPAKVEVVVGSGTTDLVLRLEPLPAPKKSEVGAAPRAEPVAVQQPAPLRATEGSSGEQPLGDAAEARGQAVEGGSAQARAEGASPEAAGAEGTSSPDREAGEEAMPSAPEPEAEGIGAGLFVAVILLVLSATAALLVLKTRSAANRNVGRSRVTRIERTSSAGTGRAAGSSFLEDLRKRERALERLVDIGPEGRGAEVIDVEVETIGEESSG